MRPEKSCSARDDSAQFCVLLPQRKARLTASNYVSKDRATIVNPRIPGWDLRCYAPRSVAANPVV